MQSGFRLLFMIPIILVSLHLPGAARQPLTAKLSSIWINNGPLQLYGLMRPILPSKVTDLDTGPSYIIGFFCSTESCTTYIFAVAVVHDDSEVVWSANRNNPVRDNATLQLTSDGDLVLRDVDGTPAWSSNTAGKSVAGLNMTQTGNLVLFDVNGSAVWQSFDHPTNTLLPGQKLIPGQKLRSSTSDENYTPGLFSVTVSEDALTFWVETNPPLTYFTIVNCRKYVEFQIGSFGSPICSHPLPSSVHYIQLNPNGHLCAYDNEWSAADRITPRDDCLYPMACGRYGVCSDDEHCSCPRTTDDSSSYFTEINPGTPDEGCSPITPLSCAASQSHTFVKLENVTYFPLRYTNDYSNMDMNQCKEACRRNCSCKAAITFSRHLYNSSDPPRCYLTTEILSLTSAVDETYIHTTFLKVQNPPASQPAKKTNIHLPIEGIFVGGSVVLIIVIGVIICFIRRKKANTPAEKEEDYLDHVPGMPTRMTYEDLRVATENFNEKLGQGGFGSVFEGVLKDSTKVAVKRLEGVSQVKRSFLAEVHSIGSIHHVNLVRLIGFCAEKSHRLLVYEYMTKGSLDNWIYNRGQNVVLDWRCRKKIIQNVAEGLEYLHDHCRQKIIHLDIKPQNILLDEAFNAKLSDFGLAKLIDRKQSKVVTTMRGTPGYLAPEWLSAAITEKVDVYSFGVVLLEILCGRKQFEETEPEESRHLLSLFKIKAERGELSNLVDRRSEDMQLHATEVVEMMQIAAWCLQNECSKRPSMSMVVKVLEGVMEVETNLDYSLLYTQNSGPEEIDNRPGDSSQLPPSVLTGPR